MSPRRLLDRIVVSAPEVGAATSYLDYRGRLTLRYLQVGALVLASCTLLWWPTDPWVFRDEPTAVDVFATTRPWVAALSTAAAVLAWALRGRPRLAPLLVLGAGVPQALFLGWHFSVLGGLDRAWFYFAYFFPLLSLLVVTGPGVRLLVAAALSLAYPLGYFARTPEYAQDGRFGISISFLVFVVLMATVVGHVIERLLHRHFEDQCMLERRVQERTAQLRRLASHIEDEREAERRRLARDLHDEFGQLMTALRLELGIVERSAEGSQRQAGFGRVQALVDEGFSTYRRLVDTLRPPVLDDVGLDAAVQRQLEQVRQRTSLEVDFRATGEPKSLSDRVATVAYRLVQEAVTNVVRHAEAKRLRVRLTVGERQVEVEVCDDGRGTSEAEEGFGVMTMRERVAALGGRLTIESAPEQGTKLRAVLPLE